MSVHNILQQNFDGEKKKSKSLSCWERFGVLWIRTICKWSLDVHRDYFQQFHSFSFLTGSFHSPAYTLYTLTPMGSLLPCRALTGPLGAISGSVSCPRTLLHANSSSQDLLSILWSFGNVQSVLWEPVGRINTMCLHACVRNSQNQRARCILLCHLKKQCSLFNASLFTRVCLRISRNTLYILLYLCFIWEACKGSKYACLSFAYISQKCRTHVCFFFLLFIHTVLFTQSKLKWFLPFGKLHAESVKPSYVDIFPASIISERKIKSTLLHPVGRLQFKYIKNNSLLIFLPAISLITLK